MEICHEKHLVSLGDIKNILPSYQTLVYYDTIDILDNQIMCLFGSFFSFLFHQKRSNKIVRSVPV